MRNKLNTYKLFWLDGKIDEIKAESLVDAFMKLGYGAGTLPGLDYWVKVK